MQTEKRMFIFQMRKKMNFSLIQLNRFRKKKISNKCFIYILIKKKEEKTK